MDPLHGEHAHVAIDGPVASGKTTVAKLLARRLGCLYLDTGAMYRALAYKALHDGIDADNAAAMRRALDESALRIVSDATALPGYRVFLDGTEIGDRLFAADVTAVVSTVAAHPAVRDSMVDKQRAIALEGPLVMAGRDIGTVVLPDARFKFFLTASLAERVERRRAELAAGGVRIDYQHLSAQIAERDRLDETRAVAPLRAAADAAIIDSTSLAAEAVVEDMLARMACR